jgi:hypothetical protein
MVAKGDRTAADAARLSKIHPAPFPGYWREHHSKTVHAK